MQYSLFLIKLSHQGGKQIIYEFNKNESKKKMKAGFILLHGFITFSLSDKKREFIWGQSWLIQCQWAIKSEKRFWRHKPKRKERIGGRKLGCWIGIERKKRWVQEGKIKEKKGRRSWRFGAGQREADLELGSRGEKQEQCLEGEVAPNCSSPLLPLPC